MCVSCISASARSWFSLIRDSTYFSSTCFCGKNECFHPSPFLSATVCVLLFIELFCHTILVRSCFIVYEGLTCCARVGNPVWWRSFGKVRLSDDGVFLLLSFSLLCLWNCVHSTTRVRYNCSITTTKSQVIQRILIYIYKKRDFWLVLNPILNTVQASQLVASRRHLICERVNTLYPYCVWHQRRLDAARLFVPSPLCSGSVETDDYAEIIDEEDTYTMPSSKYKHTCTHPSDRSSLCTCASALVITGPLQTCATHGVCKLVSVHVCAGFVSGGECHYKCRLIYCVSRYLSVWFRWDKGSYGMIARSQALSWLCRSHKHDN